MTHNDTAIGIIGDGQLALMLGEALVKRGRAFLCLSSSKESPVHSFFPDHIISDPATFREKCDVFTLENEFHSIPELQDLLKDKADRLFPSLQSYSFFSNKISQRTFYEAAGIPSPRWMALKTSSDLESVQKNFPFPFVLKTSRGGYDGKGVRIIKNEEDFQQALIEFSFSSGNELLIEEKVSIVKEVAQGFVRGSNGPCTLLPLVHTVQEEGVCNLVHYPALVSPEVEKEVESSLEKMIAKELVGIFNFEFFIDSNNRVLINEGAPRTHNSQHLTIDASSLSQFDVLALYLTNPALAPAKLSTHPSLMINILGKRSGSPGDLKLPELPSVEVFPKLYGKVKSSPGRKMGHVNLVDKEGKIDLLSCGRKILKEYDL